MPTSVKKQSFAPADKEEANISGTEKVSVNVNIASLSQIDLLVDTGFYSGRSDFINQAVREKLQQQQSLVESAAETVRRRNGSHQWFLGIQHLSRTDVEAMYAAGEKLSLTGEGLLSIDGDCDPEKVYAVFEKIRVRGKFVCTDEIRSHYFPDGDGRKA